jgi:N6-L-threonylcarbamoyladenine synthase
MVDTLVKNPSKRLPSRDEPFGDWWVVSCANTHLRETLEAELAKINATVQYAPPALRTDNGAMIAYAGYERLQAGQSDDLAVSCVPRWLMIELP